MDDQIQTQLAAAVAGYQTPPQAAELLKQNPPLVVASVTAGGKDAIAQRIQETSDYRRIITTTTRPMREGEANGREYWFVTDQQMLELINQQAFIEVKTLHAQQTSGSSIAAYQSILDSGNKPLLIIDVQGIQEVIKHIPSLNPVFILPPSFDEWMKRLGGRGHMSHVEKLRRLKSAESEIELALRNQDFRLVVNRQIPDAATEIVSGQTDMRTQQANREIAQQLLDQIRDFR